VLFFQILLSSINPSQYAKLNCRFLSAAASEAPTVVPTVQSPDKLFQKVNIELKSHDKAVLKSYTTVLKAAATHLDVPSGEM
jgi:hypothetical protein